MAWAVLALSLAAVALPVHAAQTASAPQPDGKQIYQERCASCHDGGAPNIPTRAQLSGLAFEDAIQTLTAGAMAAQAQGLSPAQLGALAIYVTGKGPRKDPPADANLCKSAPAPIDLSGPQWNGWGRDLANTRYQSDPELSASDVPHLKLKWAFSYPGNTVYGQPTIVSGRLFVTSVTGRIFALDAATGCTLWSYDGGAGSRTAISIGPAQGIAGVEAIAYFGDEKAMVHALDADTGKQIWQAKAEDHPMAILTGAPTLYAGRLYVPVSSYEEIGIAPNYACCTFRGSVVALDAMTGKEVWKSYAIPQTPQPYRKNDAGTQLFGPAGAAVWSSPTIDVKKKRLYVATGNSYTDVKTSGNDAVVAMD